MVEWTQAGMQAETDQKRLEALLPEVRLFKRLLVDRFEMLGPETQSFCGEDIKIVITVLSKLDQTLLDAKSMCAKKVADEQK